MARKNKQQLAQEQKLKQQQNQAPEFDELDQDEEFEVVDCRGIDFIFCDEDILFHEKLNLLSKFMYTILCYYSMKSERDVQKDFNLTTLAKIIGAPLGRKHAYVGLREIMKRMYSENIGLVGVREDVREAAHRILKNTDMEELRNEQ